MRTAALHDGFSVCVRTLLLQEGLQMSSDWVEANLPPLPGQETQGTAAFRVLTQSVDETFKGGRFSSFKIKTQHFLLYLLQKDSVQTFLYSSGTWSTTWRCKMPNTPVKFSNNALLRLS